MEDEYSIRSRLPAMACRDVDSAIAVASYRKISDTAVPYGTFDRYTDATTNEWLSNDYLAPGQSYFTLDKLDGSVSLTNNPAFERYLKANVQPSNCNLSFNNSIPPIVRPPAQYRTMETYDDDTETKGNSAPVIPPLNTDIRFSSVLPYYKPLLAVNAAAFAAEHPHTPHVHLYNAENFSWAIVTDEDSTETKAKKQLIHPVQNQRMCGSCWAVCTAAVISDCFVVSGSINWSPKIAPTFIMMCLPNKPELQQKCNGGNPAEVALALETEGVCDTTCIDYSWCSNDKDICTSAEAAQHFQSGLGNRLNENIPTPCGCYFAGERYSYKIDPGSNVFSISAANGSVETFRKTIQAHIVDFGPPVGGYVVLANFTSGKFTDPKLNGGVYFDRCDYASAQPGSQLTFDDSFATQVSGLHAVSVIGWGMAKNVQYDNGKFGDVPYWHVRNSWGEAWGHEKGYFKMAMYPFNKTSQFCSQVNLPNVGSTVGSMVLIRACHPPSKVDMKAIPKHYLDAIKRMKPDSYYQQTPEQMAASTAITFVKHDYVTIGIGALCVVLVILAFTIWLFMKPSIGGGSQRRRR